MPDDVKSAKGDSKATVQTQVRREGEGGMRVRVRVGVVEGGSEGARQLKGTARQQYIHR